MKNNERPIYSNGTVTCEITSTNIGPRIEVDIFGQKKLTAYEKHSVEADLLVDAGGIVGDGHYAREAEEAKDHAVQICSTDNYEFWSERLKRPLRVGVFGESITYAGPNEFAVRIGDILRIGTLKLEVSGPRIPCAKLAHFIGEDLTFPRTYHQTSRTGIYARVLAPGPLSTAMKMEFEPSQGRLPFVSDIAAALLQREPDRDWMTAMINEPRLSVMIRNMYVKKLAALSRRS